MNKMTAMSNESWEENRGILTLQWVVWEGRNAGQGGPAESWGKNILGSGRTGAEPVGMTRRAHGGMDKGQDAWRVLNEEENITRSEEGGRQGHRAIPPRLLSDCTENTENIARCMCRT